MPKKTPSTPEKTVTSSVTLTRSETTTVTVQHPPDWTKRDIEDALGKCAGQVVDLIEEALEDEDDAEVELSVDSIEVGEDLCEIDDWDPPDLEAMEPDEDTDA